MPLSTPIRGGPFILKGVGMGVCFSLKSILIPKVAEKNILILVGGKKKSDLEFLSYNLILNSGKNNCDFLDKKNRYYNSRVVRRKISERNNKP